MDFREFIKPELLILIPVLYLIGMGIKKSELQDKYIPLSLGVCGIVFSFVYLLGTTAASDQGAVANLIFTAVTQGILVAGASVYANQIVKQSQLAEGKRQATNQACEDDADDEEDDE